MSVLAFGDRSSIRVSKALARRVWWSRPRKLFSFPDDDWPWEN